MWGTGETRHARALAVPLSQVPSLVSLAELAQNSQVDKMPESRNPKIFDSYDPKPIYSQMRRQPYGPVRWNRCKTASSGGQGC